MQFSHRIHQTVPPLHEETHTLMDTNLGTKKNKWHREVYRTNSHTVKSSSVWCLRQCETHSQCVSLAPPREPLKLSLLHSIVFHIALRRTSRNEHFSFFTYRTKDCFGPVETSLWNKHKLRKRFNNFYLWNSILSQHPDTSFLYFTDIKRNWFIFRSNKALHCCSMVCTNETLFRTQRPAARTYITERTNSSSRVSFLLGKSFPVEFLVPSD